MKKLILVSVAFLIGGCAAPARHDQMSVFTSVQRTNPALKGTVAVADVTGGKDTNPAWKSEVSSDAFRRALELSLENAGLLSKILAGSKYRLTADLIKLDQPFAGIDMTVTSTVRYSLVDAKSLKEVYGRTTQISFTAKFSDSLLGAERLRIANEGAVKENIKLLLADLEALKLP